MNEKRKFIVLDGNSLMHRAFYALPLLTNSRGEYTNAVYGFTNMFLRLLDEEKPDYLAVAFDKGRKVFRHGIFGEYKGTRQKMPDELRPQMDTLKEMLKVMNVSFIEKEGFEADDLIGTMVTAGEENGLNNIIVTGDRDSLQLVSERTRVFLTKKGITSIQEETPASFREKYGLEPSGMIEIKALMGDSSDNIPGVAGIGEKTAVRLLTENGGTLESVYDNLERYKGKKLWEKLDEGRDNAYMSRELARIVRDVDIDFNAEDFRYREPDNEKLRDFCVRYEFNTLMKRFGIDSVREKEKECEGIVLTDEKEALDILGRNGDCVYVYCETEGSCAYSAKIKGWGFRTGGKNYYLSAGSSAGRAGVKIFGFAEMPGREIVTDNAKIFHMAFIKEGRDIQCKVQDVTIAEYLIAAGEGKSDLGAVMKKYCGIETEKEGTEKVFFILECLEKAFAAQKEKFTELELGDVYEVLEMPLVKVLSHMEFYGMKVDRNELKSQGRKMKDRLNSLEKKIYAIAGTEFNVNSTRQLGEILFDKLGLPAVKKTKTGYSTDASVLEELKDKHEIINLILDYRHKSKLKSTYLDGLVKLTDPVSGNVHTSFNQTVTATGRLSSTEPNLQNIPIRTKEGRLIRKAFTAAREGDVLISADYSQIELRLLAHFSEDPVLTESFRNGEDIHARTASEVFGVPLDEVTKELRYKAKAVNFGLIYGQTDYGLSRQLSIGRKEAGEYIEKYFERYPKVQEWMSGIKDKARENGYVTTLFKRRREIPGINSRSYPVRKFAERAAVNAPLQGSSADIIKLAMIKIFRKMTEENMKSRMVLQVHDELLFEVLPEESSRVIVLVREIMEQVCPLEVPLKVDMSAGFNWYEMEDI